MQVEGWRDQPELWPLAAPPAHVVWFPRPPRHFPSTQASPEPCLQSLRVFADVAVAAAIVVVVVDYVAVVVRSHLHVLLSMQCDRWLAPNPRLVMVRCINHILAISRVLVANVDEDLQIAHDPLALPLRESLPLSVELIVNVKLQLFFLLFQVFIAWVGHCPGVEFEAWVVSHLIVKVESDFDLLILAAGRTVCQVKVHENILFNGVDDGTGGSRRDSVRLEGAGKAGHSNVGDCKMKKRSPGGATDDLANGDSDEDAEALTWGVLVKNGLASLEVTVELEHDVCRRWDFGPY
ncbi:hypothetical protein IWX50DRAFT_616447 [Phyllosticta citricarpa]